MAVVLICGFRATAAGTTESKEIQSSTVVTLAPYKVIADLFTLYYSWDKVGKITEVKVTEVTPHTAPWNNGLRAGDKLESIDGVAMSNYSKTTLVDLLASEIPPGTARTFNFTGRRGLLKLGKLSMAVKFTVAKGKKDSNATPEEKSTTAQ